MALSSVPNIKKTINVEMSNGTVAKSCSDLITGYGGHGMGLCQSGAAKMAKKGKTCEEILTYYFTNSDTEFCKMVS